MRIDNLAACPNCHASSGKSPLVRRDTAPRYGLVSKDVHQAFRGVTRANSEDKERYTLEEYRDMGISDGQFFVRYRAQCTDCEFSFGFEHAEKLRRESAKRS